MPELPEVEAIASRLLPLIGQTIVGVDVIRGKNYQIAEAVGLTITNITRRAKRIYIWLSNGSLIECHNAMTGYWDIADDPWTFDYVEGARISTDSDVRVRMKMSDGRVARFHDSRLFGRLKVVEHVLTGLGNEPISTSLGTGPLITEAVFWKGLNVNVPLKERMMDQRFIAGVGNIYSSEACHLAGLDPNKRSKDLSREDSDILLEATRCVLLLCFPQVRYDWLKVYRKTLCGTCSHPIKRFLLKGRATFVCSRCQS